jgi:hypothetical protein
MSKDPNYIIKLEKAIAEKYGEKTIINPRSLWTIEDEENYQNQISGSSNLQNNKIFEQEGKNYNFEQSKLITKEERVCSNCGLYSMDKRDNLYLNKFQLCYRCFLEKEPTLKRKGIIK